MERRKKERNIIWLQWWSSLFKKESKRKWRRGKKYDHLLWLQWSPSNPGWHWHLPRTQAPCPWHPLTHPSVNSCKVDKVDAEWRKNLKESPESFEAQEPHCAHPRRRCTRRRTSDPPPWRSWADDEPASATDVIVTTVDLNRKVSKFLHLKVLEKCETGFLMLWCTQSSNLSKVGTHCSGLYFSKKLSWNPFKCVKTSWWCSSI